MLSDAGRNPPCTLRSTSIAASRDDRRVPNYRPRPNRASLDEERPRRSGRTTETIRGRRPGSPAGVPVVDRQSDKLDRRARPLRATRTRAAGGEHRRGWTRSQSAPVAQPSALLVVKTGRLRRASEPQREKTNPVIVWISLYSLVAVGLPHHHGVGVGGLAGGDHGGLVEDGGDGGHGGHIDW